MEIKISPAQREEYKEELYSQVLSALTPSNMNENIREIVLKDWKYATSEDGKKMIEYIISNKDTIPEEELIRLTRRFSQAGSGKIFILPLLWECKNISQGILLSNVFVTETYPPTEPPLYAAFMRTKFPEHIYAPIKAKSDPSQIIPNMLIMEARGPDGVATHFFGISQRDVDDHLLMSLVEAIVLFPPLDVEEMQKNLNISTAIWKLGNNVGDEEKEAFRKRMHFLCDKMLDKLKVETSPDLRFYYKRILGDILLWDNGDEEMSRKIVFTNVALPHKEEFERAFILSKDSALKNAKITGDKETKKKIYDEIMKEYKSLSSEAHNRGLPPYQKKMRLYNAATMLINSGYFGPEEQREFAKTIYDDIINGGPLTQPKEEIIGEFVFRIMEALPQWDYEAAKILLSTKSSDIYNALLMTYRSEMRKEIEDAQKQIATDWQELMKKRNITKSASVLINKLMDISCITSLTDERYEEILNHQFNTAKPSERPNNFPLLVNDIASAPTTPEKYLIRILKEQQPKVEPETLVALYCSQNGYERFQANALSAMLNRNYNGNKTKILKNIEVIDMAHKTGVDIDNFLQFLRDCPYIQEEVYKTSFEGQIETIQKIYDDFKTFECDKDKYLLCYSPSAFFNSNKPSQKIIREITRNDDYILYPAHEMLLKMFEKEEEFVQAHAIKDLKPQKDIDFKKPWNERDSTNDVR